MNAIGIKDAGDFNSGSVLGSQWFPVTIVPQSQRRASSQNTYLTVSDLPNLTVYTNTMAKKIVFDDQKKAIAVKVQTQGNLYTLRVNKEVIVSAGAFQSPQLLMVSGVGPASTLKEHSIPLIHDNPNVGQHLIDHTWFGPSYRVKVETITKWTNDAFYMLNQYAGPYQQQQNGPLTTNAGDFGAFEKIPEDLRSNFTAGTLKDLATFPSDWPEVEVRCFLSFSVTALSLQKLYDLTCSFPVRFCSSVLGEFQQSSSQPAKGWLHVRVYCRCSSCALVAW